ncbi:hypothetical protein Tco_0201003 [Tanacetum coccineum]
MMMKKSAVVTVVTTADALGKGKKNLQVPLRDNIALDTLDEVKLGVLLSGYKDDRGQRKSSTFLKAATSVVSRQDATRLEGYDLMLWGDLYTLFESDEEDEIWKNQHEYNLISWRLYDFCGIHILLMENGLAIHMLTEKKYPLSQELLSKMLSKKLEVDHESSQAIELLRFIRSQVKK